MAVTACGCLCMKVNVWRHSKLFKAHYLIASGGFHNCLYLYATQYITQRCLATLISTHSILEPSRNGQFYVNAISEFCVHYCACVLASPLAHLYTLYSKTWFYSSSLSDSGVLPAVRWSLWWINASSTPNGWNTSRRKTRTWFLLTGQQRQPHLKSCHFLQLNPQRYSWSCIERVKFASMQVLAT